MLGTCVADGCHKGQRHDVEKLVRPVMMHPRLWLVVWAWCLIGWTAPAQASWEAYQQAGEAAYSRGRYTEAERMFLAAVREARRFGPQDPRLDISLNKLALLRVTRSQQAHVQSRAQRTARKKAPARQGRVSRRSRQRQQPQHPGRRARHGSKRQAAQSLRRVMLHTGQPRIAPLWLQQGTTA